ncbi:MAG: hypothetical protein ABIJ43_03000 [Candidatus Beckwithbacteria bacterium]|nr:hypothetical protein [Patescibacteria group bacterium]
MSKLIIGWFTFTCCEDSTILMTELLNTHWQDWLKHLDFKYAKVFRKSPPLGPMDVAFIEGAISSKKQEEKLKQIRKLAKIVVAIGSCAVTGQPSSQRNQFDPKQQAEIKFILERFDYAEKVQIPADIVTVNHSISGCPMNEQQFIDYINQLILATNTKKS